MMELPIGYRVSGLFGPKAQRVLLKIDFPQEIVCIASPEGSRNNYEGCYYVTPRILRAHTHVGRRVLRKGAHAQP